MTGAPRIRAPVALALGLGLAALACAADARAQHVDSTSPSTTRARHGRPWCPAAVPDGARVRAVDAAARRTHAGTALGWATSAPRLVTTRGDTLPLGPDHALSVSEGRAARRKWQGALVGWLGGVAAVVGDCGLARTCGEQNPLPLLGAVLGGVVGNQLRRERWTRATAAGCAPAAAPGDD